MEGIDFGTEPRALTIDEIVLKGLAAKLVIAEDGSSNISSLPVAVGNEKQERPEQEAAENGVEVAIKKVVVEMVRWGLSIARSNPPMPPSSMI